MWFTFPLPVVKTHHYGDLEPFDNSEILMLLKEALYLMVDWQSASYFNNWQKITALPQLPFVFLSCWMFCQVLTWLWFPITPRSLRQFTYGFLLPHHKEMKNVNAKHCFLTITIAAVRPCMLHFLELVWPSGKWLARSQCSGWSRSKLRTECGWVLTFQDRRKMTWDVWWWRESICITTGTVYEALPKGQTLG